MIDVTTENFETEVIEASKTTPVLVDFWAPWCGPCKSLGPVLEKLDAAYEGRFVLAKVNSDEEQQIAGMFGIRSIPTCVLLVGGQPVDGFTGAKTEGQVREFLDKHLPPAAEPPQEEPPAEPLDESPAAELERLQTALMAKPDDDDTRCAYVALLLKMGQSDAASAAFTPLAPKAGLVRKIEALGKWLAAIKNVANEGLEPWTNAQFDEKIALNKRDFDARYGKAQIFMTQQRWTDAMDELLEILMRDRTWEGELARKTYVAILELMSPPPIKVADGQIPPQDPVVATYRRRLSMVILS